MESSAPRAPRRRERRPERQQIMLRRGLALGGALVLLILIVLGVKGCLDARANRQLSDYARNVTQIVEETQQTSKAFFARLEDPGDLSVTDFTNEVEADRSAMDNYASRVDGLGAPGDMSGAQSTLELVYTLRSSAMNEIADKMSSALADEGVAEQATRVIANQMQKFLASDVLYETVVRPEVDAVLAANGVDGSDVPKSSFLPDDSWLEESTVVDALGVLGGGGSEAGSPGIHGLGLGSVLINGTELIEGREATVAVEETAEVEVQVANQGESAENDVTVSVSVDGNAVEGDISTIEAGEIATVTIPLTTTPSGTVALEVKVDTVPGEKISDNNEATYTVTFE